MTDYMHLKLKLMLGLPKTLKYVYEKKNKPINQEFQQGNFKYNGLSGRRI